MFIKTKIFKAITFKSSSQLPLSYWILVFLRFASTLLPQRGYIHPDEFFQNIEVIAGDIFVVDVARTWEFNPKFPIRNILVPKLIIGTPLYFIKNANPFLKYYFNIDLRTPYFLIILPRLFVCSLSLINDYCLYKICILYGQNFKNRLNIFASSYIMLVYCTHTFSNTFEMIFFSVLLLLVAECMFNSDKIIYHNEFLNEKYKQALTTVDKVKILKLQKHLPYHSLNRVAIIASVVVVGIFNRPTFVGFAFSPVFFWLHRGLGTKVVGFKDFHCRIITLIASGIPSVILLILVDSSYYGYLTMADIDYLKISWENWVVTPLNFLRYNLDKQNLIEHGLHPRWLHLAVNIPLLFNVLGVMAILILLVYSYRFTCGQYNKLPRIQSITGLMLFSLIIPVAVLSLFPHQEARFIIPVLVPIVYLYGNYLYPTECDGLTSKHVKKVLLCTWYISNIILTIFFGFIHQGGIYPFASDLHTEIKNNYGIHTHVITTHSYSIPTFLLQLESTTRIYKDKKTRQNYRLAPSTFIYKYGSMPINELFIKVDEVLTNAELLLHKRKKHYRFYLAVPCSLEPKIYDEAKKFHYINIAEEFIYYPHFCSEAFPNFPTVHDQFCLENNFINKNQSQVVNLTIFHRISCFFKRFCLKIYRVSPADKF